MTDDEPPTLDCGCTIGERYQIVRHLARGDALDVYEGWSKDRLCSCVIKIIRPDRQGETRVVRRLAREGRLLTTLHHPHLVRAYETLNGPIPAVILETLQGATLEYLLETRPRRLHLTDLAHLGAHLCSAVHYLHRHGYLHCDIKPSNVVASCGMAKLIDLSLARPPGPGRRGAGTPPYLAREKARGELLGAATDVWEIGVTL